MYERRHEPLLPRAAFRRRVVGHAAAATGVVVGSLGFGTLGYHIFEGMPWIDALLNASMLLGGMGPVGELHRASGKVFASVFALYSGVVFLIVASLIFAPAFHRFLHRFHLELTGEEPAPPESRPRPKGKP
jgi:hypothetical protein